MSDNQQMTTKEEEAVKKIQSDLFWLANAPMFIDSDQVERVYDALGLSVGKMQRVERTGGSIEVTEEVATRLLGGAEIGGEVGSSGLAKLLGDFTARMNLKGEAERSDSESETVSYDVEYVETPQRQLVQLVLQYVKHYPSRLFFPRSTDSERWRKPDEIVQSPHQLVFLDFPSLEESAERDVPETKFIPTAAEFSNGKIISLYNELHAENGERPPTYPEKHKLNEEGEVYDIQEKLRDERDDYWKWFDNNFRPRHAMKVVEEAASANGRIQWIDYRVPITKRGETMHLHVCPAGRYANGTFAYNLIKRGYKHGVRIIGTLKSEPDMNVLSIYEK